jgi:hypothetical protein
VYRHVLTIAAAVAGLVVPAVIVPAPAWADSTATVDISPTGPASAVAGGPSVTIEMHMVQHSGDAYVQPVWDLDLQDPSGAIMLSKAAPVTALVQNGQMGLIPAPWVADPLLANRSFDYTDLYLTFKANAQPGVWHIRGDITGYSMLAPDSVSVYPNVPINIVAVWSDITVIAPAATHPSTTRTTPTSHTQAAAPAASASAGASLTSPPPVTATRTDRASPPSPPTDLVGPVALASSADQMPYVLGAGAAGAATVFAAALTAGWIRRRRRTAPTSTGDRD